MRTLNPFSIKVKSILQKRIYTTKKFILKVDLIPSEALNIAEVALDLSKNFDRIETKQIKGFHVSFTKSDPEFSEKDAFDYVLISESGSYTMTFSETQYSFWLESNHYQNSSLYKDIIKKAIEVIRDKCSDIDAKRIGLRYINEFACESDKKIAQVYGKRLTSIMKYMIDENNKSRIIGMEEYNNDGCKLRLQYGLPNKFYPSVISVYDLLFDIDSYVDSKFSLDEWETVISQLNHNAYDKFVTEIHPKHLDGLR